MSRAVSQIEKALKLTRVIINNKIHQVYITLGGLCFEFMH